MTVDEPTRRYVAAALNTIPHLAERLELETTQATPTERGGAGKPESRPPAPIAYLSDLAAAWSTLTGWARDIAEFVHHTGTVKPTWAGVCELLLRYWPVVADTHPGAAEFADEIAGRGALWGDQHVTGTAQAAYLVDSRQWSVQQRLARHVADARNPWRPIVGRWRCPAATDSQPTCGGRLREHVEQHVIVCDACRRSWTADAYEQLARMLGMEPLVTIEQAALLAHVHAKTVERWIRERALPVVEADGRRLVDKRDLAILLTRAG